MENIILGTGERIYGYSVTNYGTSYSYGEKVYTSDPIEMYINNSVSATQFKQIDRNNIVVGPFAYTSNLTPDSIYCTVYFGNGTSTSGSFCNSNGSSISARSTSCTFYIKVPKSYCQYGISKITVTGKKWRTGYQNVYVYQQKTFSCGSSYQKVQENSSHYIRTDTHDISYTSSSSVSWTYFQKGSLDVVKVDYDQPNVKLPNAKFRITGPNNYNVTATTDQYGEIRLSNLTPGNYTITEISNSNYGYTKMVTGTATVSRGTHVTITLKNVKQTGALRIVKEDPDLDERLNGFGFKIKTGNDNLEGQNNKYIKVNGKSTITGAVVINSLEYTTDKSSATTFVTGSGTAIGVNGERYPYTGMSKIVNILLGTYYVEEVSVGNNYYGYEVDSNYIAWATAQGEGAFGTTKYGNNMSIKITTRISSIESSVTGAGLQNCGSIRVYNTRKYVKVSGTVWEDIISGKGNKSDGIKKDGDILLKGIKVRLKDGNTVIKETTTDSNGAYVFNDVLIGGTVNGKSIRGLSYYYVEFEYDGEIYTTVKSYSEQGKSKSAVQSYKTSSTTVSNGAMYSKAAEVDRTTLDNNYSNITSNGSTRKSTATTTTGKINSSNTVTYNLNTEEAIYKNYDTFDNLKVTDNSKNVSSMYSFENYSINKITATTTGTDANNYNVLGSTTISNIRTKGITELTERNCGLVQRERVDLSISTDIDNVKVEVNQYTNTYKYGLSSTYKSEDQFKADVKAKTVAGYTRTMYASDIVVNENSKDTTKVWITYKITIRNNSDTLSAKTTKLGMYYDSRSDIVASGTSSELEDGTYGIKWTKSSGTTTVNGLSYSYSTTNGFDSGTIEKESSKIIYVKCRLSNDALLSILDANDGITLGSVVEIGGYNTYYGDNTYYHKTGKTGKQYASIDMDSAPEDVAVGYVSTYEDDTATDPTITIKLTEEERTIKGTIFDDDVSDSVSDVNAVNTNTQRLGDGIYNDSKDGTVENVQVDLLVYDTNKLSTTEKDGYTQVDENLYAGLDTAELYKYTETGNYNTGNADVTKIKTYKTYTLYKQTATTTTTKEGYYEFSGIIPNKYILRFTYKDGNIVYKAGENEGTSIDVTYYKATILKSDVIKDALNNNKIVGDGSTEGKNIKNNPEYTNYASNKWYLIDEKTRYTDAMDTNFEISEANKYVTINNSNYNDTRYDDKTSKEAYTGVMNVQVEFSAEETSGDEKVTNTTLVVENSDGTYNMFDQLQRSIENIDFGIVEKAKQYFELSKEIANIKITLANGQVLVDGDPSKDTLQYVKYLPDNENGKIGVDLEIDSELLYGSTLEITYKIVVENLSELNYTTVDYYKYGTKGTDADKETITMSKVIDYLDNDLVYAENASTSNVELIENHEQLDGLLSDDVYEAVKDYATKLILNSDKKLVPYDGKNLDDSSESWTYSASKVLATSDDLTFANDVEVIETNTTNTPTISSIPGNYNPTTSKPEEPNEYNVEIVITSPTGGDKTVTVYIIGAIALIVLASGIIIIKRKVL